MVMIRTIMYHDVGAFFRSPIFWSAFGAYVAASLFKTLGNLLRTGKVDFHYLTRLGGMPSAHSAMVCGLTVSIGLMEGFGSSCFAISFAFAAVVMFDASTVRRATGLQARLLNQIVDEVYKSHHLSAQKLIEILGHTRLEVFAGMIVGIATGILTTYLMN